MEHIWFYILFLVAEVLGTLGGFGSSMLLVPLISYTFGFQQALLLTAGIHVISNIWKVVLFQHGLDRKLVLTFGIPGVVAVIIGAFLSKYLNETVANGLLGAFLVSVSLFLFIMPNFTVKPTTPNTITGGVLSGFTAGILGTGGAIRGVFLAAYAIEVNVFIATSAIIDLGIDSSRFVVYLTEKEVDYSFLLSFWPVVFLSLAGSYLGKLLLQRVSPDVFKKIVLVLVFATGAISIYKFIMAFVA